jgi:hypothetical protein
MHNGSGLLSYMRTSYQYGAVERGHVSRTGVERGHWVYSIEVQAVQLSFR